MVVNHCWLVAAFEAMGVSCSSALAKVPGWWCFPQNGERCPERGCFLSFHFGDSF